MPKKNEKCGESSDCTEDYYCDLYLHYCSPCDFVCDRSPKTSAIKLGGTSVDCTSYCSDFKERHNLKSSQSSSMNSLVITNIVLTLVIFLVVIFVLSYWLCRKKKVPVNVDKSEMGLLLNNEDPENPSENDQENRLNNSVDNDQELLQATSIQIEGDRADLKSVELRDFGVRNSERNSGNSDEINPGNRTTDAVGSSSGTVGVLMGESPKQEPKGSRKKTPKDLPTTNPSTDPQFEIDSKLPSHQIEQNMVQLACGTNTNINAPLLGDLNPVAAGSILEGAVGGEPHQPRGNNVLLEAAAPMTNMFDNDSGCGSVLVNSVRPSLEFQQMNRQMYRERGVDIDRIGQQDAVVPSAGIELEPTDLETSTPSIRKSLPERLDSINKTTNSTSLSSLSAFCGSEHPCLGGLLPGTSAGSTHVKAVYSPGTHIAPNQVHGLLSSIPPQTFHDSSSGSPAEDQYYFEGSKDLRGLCVVIDNTKFRDRHDLYRKDTGEKNMDYLKLVWETLGFEFKPYFDVSEAELLQIIEDTKAKLREGKHGCFVCCILTHGKLGKIMTSDCKEIDIKKSILKPFSLKNLPEFANQPKVFLLHSCRIFFRGQHGDSVGIKSLQNGVLTSLSSEESQKSLCYGFIYDGMQDPEDMGPAPPSDHFLVIYVCRQGELALGNPVMKGSLFVLHMCECIMNDKINKDKVTEINFLDLLEEVVNSFVSLIGNVQCPIYFSRLKKNLIFQVR